MCQKEFQVTSVLARNSGNFLRLLVYRFVFSAIRNSREGNLQWISHGFRSLHELLLVSIHTFLASWVKRFHVKLVQHRQFSLFSSLSALLLSILIIGFSFLSRSSFAFRSRAIILRLANYRDVHIVAIMANMWSSRLCPHLGVQLSYQLVWVFLCIHVHVILAVACTRTLLPYTLNFSLFRLPDASLLLVTCRAQNPRVSVRAAHEKIASVSLPLRAYKNNPKNILKMPKSTQI